MCEMFTTVCIGVWSIDMVNNEKSRIVTGAQ